MIDPLIILSFVSFAVLIVAWLMSPGTYGSDEVK